MDEIETQAVKRSLAYQDQMGELRKPALSAWDDFTVTGGFLLSAALIIVSLLALIACAIALL